MKVKGWICDSCDNINQNTKVCLNCEYQYVRGERKNVKIYFYRGRKMTARQHAALLGVTPNCFRIRYKRQKLL